MGNDLVYRQSFGFSCGPAALMTVMKQINNTMILDRSMELDIWRDATLIESKATSSFGLALAARRRGYKVKVMTDSDRIGFISRLVEHFPGINVDFMKLLFDRTRENAIKEGVDWDRKEVMLDDIEKEIDSDNQPIILISSKMMRELIGIPHWVVVIGYDRKHFWIKNPETARVERYTRKRFEKYLGFTGYRCMIVLGSEP